MAKLPVLAMMSSALAGGAIELRASADAAVLTQAEKDRMLQAVRSNAPGAPMRLVLTAVTYLQPETPNLKFARMKPAALRAFVESSPGSPFLRDHEQENLLARGGTVLSSKLITRNGAPAIEQSLELVKPWAIEGVLDGTIDRFSIAWSSPDGVECSVCGQQMFGRMSTCSHWPGDSYASSDGEMKVCEMLFPMALSKETSAVSVPAVANTEIESVRAELSAARTTTPKGAPPMFEKIRVSLGLAAGDETLSEDRLVAEIATLRRTGAEAQAMLAAEREGRTALDAELAAARKELKAAEAAKAQATIDAIVDQALSEGKILPGRGPKGEKLDAAGKRIQGAGEEAIRILAAASPDGARAWVKTLKPVVALAAAGAVDKPPSEDQNLHSISEGQRKVNAQLGISDEDYMKARPKGPRATLPPELAAKKEGE